MDKAQDSKKETTSPTDTATPKTRLKGKLKDAAKKATKVRVRKVHLDYIVGILSIPVLITAIILNFANLNKNKAATAQASPTPQIIVVPASQNSLSPKPTTSQSCTRTIGPVDITFPQEGQEVATNPLCINIDYSNSNFCPVVWSYRINGASWSDYNNNSPCIYNLPNGSVSFQLKVNSTVSTETKTLTRNFTYDGANNPTATPLPTSILSITPTPSSSSSANTIK